MGATGGQDHRINEEKTPGKRGIEIVNQSLKGTLKINNKLSEQKHIHSGNLGPLAGNLDPSATAKSCKKKLSGPNPEPHDLHEGKVLFRTVELGDTCSPLLNGGTGLSIQYKSCNKHFSNFPQRESVNPGSPLKDGPGLNLAKRDHGQHSIVGRADDPNQHFILKRGFMTSGGKKVPVCHPHIQNHLKEYQNSNFGWDQGELHVHDNSNERGIVNGNNNNKPSHKGTPSRPTERCDDIAFNQKFVVGNGQNTRTSPYLSDEKKGRMGSLMKKQSKVMADLKLHTGLTLNSQNELSYPKIHDPNGQQP